MKVHQTYYQIILIILTTIIIKKKIKKDSKKLQEKYLKESNKKIRENMKKICFSSDDNENNSNDNNKSKNSLLNGFESLIESKLNDSIELNNYDTPSMNELLKSVTLTPNDASKELNVDTYENEKYLPNYITPLGENAPVQPLLYQNGGYGNERINKKVIIVDSGFGDTLSTVKNLDGLYWHKYKADYKKLSN